MEKKWEREWSERCFHFMLKYLDKTWDWDGISSNPNITWNTIEANPEKPWNWYWILQKKDITWKMIQGQCRKVLE